MYINRIELNFIELILMRIFLSVFMYSDKANECILNYNKLKRRECQLMCAVKPSKSDCESLEIVEVNIVIGYRLSTHTVQVISVNTSNCVH